MCLAAQTSAFQVTKVVTYDGIIIYIRAIFAVFRDSEIQG